MRMAQVGQVLDNPEAPEHMDFEEAFQRTMDIEGRGKLHTTPGDRGGTTKWGISQRAFPNLDIASLTEDQARLIYRQQYWDRVNAEELPDALRGHVFDSAMNQGTQKAALLLQKAVNIYGTTRGGPAVAQDGVIGPATIQAVKTYDPDRLTTLFRHLRREEYLRLAKAGQGAFLFGWLGRA